MSEKRFFKVHAGMDYTVVATDPNHAWRLIGEHFAITDAGFDLLDEDVCMSEMAPERVDTAHVFDENGPSGTDVRYPLRRAEVGAVFQSEW